MLRSTFQSRDRELIQAPNYCHVSVPADDGTIQTVIVWCDLEDDRIVLNSAEGRDWPANLRRAGGATITVMNLENPEEAKRSPLGQAIVDAPEGLFGWAVAVEDVVVQAERLSLEVTTIAREDLTARLAGVAQAVAEPWLPFFIQRDPGIADPGASGDGGGIAWLELAADADRLPAWLGGADLPLRFSDDRGPRGLRALGPASGTVIS